MSKKTSAQSNRRSDLLLERLENRILFDAAPDVQVEVPEEEMINEDFQFSVSFDNTSNVSSEAGFGPFIDLHIPEEIDFDPSSATYLGSPVNVIEAGVFNADGDLVDGDGNPVDHPFLESPVTGGAEGDTLYVIELPFGSFVPDQPAATIDLEASLSKADGAVVGEALDIKVQAGFRYGQDAEDNPGDDPPIVGALHTTSITPTVIDLIKTNDAPEQERSTGENFPITYTLTVDIADGETVTDLQIRDMLPENLQFLEILDPDGGTVTSTPTTGAPAANNEFVIEFASVTGTAATDDLTITYRTFIPKFDADSGDIINPDDGDDEQVLNEASVTATYEGNTVGDGDDDPLGTYDDDETDNIVTAKSIAIQKGVSIAEDNFAEGATPGDVLLYSLNFQVSDYFSFSDIVIDDVFSDGQQFVDGFTPTLTIHENGDSFDVTFSADNYDVTVDPVNGTTHVQFRLSDELVSQGRDSTLDGALFADGTLGSGTVGTITFQTEILEDFREDHDLGGNSGDSSVDVGDILTNNVTIDGALNGSDGNPNGFREADTSGTSIQITGLNVIKDIYAIDGDTGFSSTEIRPGETVTYRLYVALPSADIENLVLTDYLPLPLFDSTEMLIFDNTTPGSGGYNNNPPAAGTVKYGENHTLKDVLPGLDPTLSTDGDSNSFALDFGTFDVEDSGAAVVELLFTVTAQDAPFADGLFHTNQLNTSYGRTNQPSTQSNAIVPITLRTPELHLSKGVVSTNSTNQVFDAATGPVAFESPGNDPGTDPAFSTSFTSADLATSPVDANLTGADAGDLVKFALVIENQGGGDAFDLILTDELPDGFEIPSTGQGLNLEIYNANGDALTFTGSAADLFTPGGLEIVDPGGVAAINSQTDADAESDGSNIIIITYDLILADDIQPVETEVGTAEIDSYAGVDNGENYVPPGFGTLSDDATVVTDPAAVTKTLESTSIDNANNSGTEAVIGEYAEYEVRIRIPEGEMNQAQLVDTLDSGLRFVSLDSITTLSGGAATGDISTSIGTGDFSDVNSFDPSISSNGRVLTFDFGTLTNANRDNSDIEEVVLRYTVRVDNSASNDGNGAAQGSRLNNSAQLQWQVDGTASSSNVSRATNVEVIEPLLVVDSQVTQAGQDADDAVEYTITISHDPTNSEADAFDVTFADVIPDDITITGFTASHPTIANLDTRFEQSGNTIQTIAGQSFDLLLGETVTIVVSGTLNDTVQPREVLTDAASIEWTSIDNDTPASGDVDNERTGDDNSGADPQNDYSATDAASMTIASPTIAKAFTSTSVSDANNANDEATIGELVTYTVTLTLPEGTMNLANVVDTLPSGIEWVSLDSIQTFSDGVPTSDITSTAGDFTTQLSNFNPAISGQQLTFDFETLENANKDNSQAETLVITYTSRVTNVAANQGNGEDPGTTLTGTAATLNWQVNGNDESDTSANAGNVEVIEPELLIDTVVDQATANAGDSIQYTITISHDPDNSDTDAYEVTFSDPVPDGVIFDINDVTVLHSDTTEGTAGDITSRFEVDTNTLRTIDGQNFDLQQGETVTITIDGTLSVNVQPNEQLVNTASIEWTSLDGTETGERTGNTNSGADPQNDYRASDPATTTINSPVPLKELIGTSIANGTSGANENVVIGETAQYRVTVTLTEGTTVNSRLIDTLDTGLEFVSFDSIQTFSDGVLTNDITSDGVVVNTTDTDDYTVGISGQQVTFDLGDLVNNNTDNAKAETIVLTYTARVTNDATNVGNGSAQGQTLDNTAAFHWEVDGANQQTATVNAEDLEVIEPLLTLTKVSDINGGDSGDAIEYTITIQHDATHSEADAFDVTFSDFVPDIIDFDISDVTVTHSDTTDLTGLFIVGANNELRTDTGDTFDLLLGQSVTITIQGTLADDVQPGESFQNTATARWTSLNDSNDPTSPERDGSGGTDSYTASVTSAAVTIPEATLAKALVSTSIENGGDNDRTEATIGELATYSLTITLPEGTMHSSEIADLLPVGMEYVGLVSIEAFSDGVATTDITAQLSGDPGVRNFDTLADFEPGVTGEALAFDFGTLRNHNTNNDATETLVITYQARVTNVAGNQGNGSSDGTELTGRAATLSWDVDGDDHTANSNAPTDVEVVEPELQITQSISTDTPNPDAGDSVTYNMTISHTPGSDTDAFDVTFSDDVPSEIDFTMANVTTNLGANASDFFTIVGNELQTKPGVTFDLLKGDTVTVQIVGTLNSTMEAGEAIDNTAHIAWTSMDGTPTGERTGDDGAAGLNNYVDSSETRTVNALEATVTKTLDSTSIEHADNTRNEAVIGELATYSVTITLPEGRLPSSELIDTLDVGLEFVSLQSITAFSDGVATNQITSTVGDFTTDLADFAPSESGQQLTFDLGTLENTNRDNDAVETLVVTYQVRVTNIAGNQSNGLAQGTLLDNQARFDWDGGGVAHQTATVDADDIEVIEPELTITQTISDETPTLGERITYTLTISHLNTSDADAFDLNILETLPSELTIDTDTIDVTGATITDDSSDGNNLNLTLDRLDLGDTITITFEADVTTDASAINSDHTTTSDLTWTSLANTPTGERTGANPAGVDDYVTDADETFRIVATPTVSKALVGADQDASIGETFQYTVTVTAPEGTTYGAELVDVLPDGLEFVSLDQIQTFSDGNPTNVISTTLGDGDFTDTSTFDPNIAGQTHTYTLGDITNTDTDTSTIETVVLTYTVQVTNTTGNQSNGSDPGTILDPPVHLEYQFNGETEQTAQVDPADLEVVEPDLQVEQVVNIPTGDAGDTVTYTFTITHTDASDADAFDATFVNTLPDEFDFDITGVTAESDVNGAFTPATLFNVDGQTLETAIGQSFDVAQGEEITITITGTLLESVEPEQEIENSASIEWTSRDGDVVGERTGDGTNSGLNDYNADSNTTTVTIDSPGIVKELTNTSIENGGNNDRAQATIGEVVTYTLRVTLPEGTINSAAIVDNLPDGLEFLEVTGVQVQSGGVATTDVSTTIGSNDFTDPDDFTPNNNAGELTFDLGDILNENTNNANAEVVTITYTARVLNIAANDGNGSAAGTVFAGGTAAFQWEHDGVTKEVVSAAAADVETVEPQLNILKEIDDDEPNLDQRVTYTLTITHTDQSDTDAHNLTIADTLPDGLTLDAGTISVVGATVDSQTVDGNEIDLELDFLAVGNTITITYEAVVTDDVTRVDDVLSNTADLTWTSLGGDVVFERTGDDPDGVDDYADDSTELATIIQPDLLVDNDDSLTEVEPGQQYTYTVTVTNQGTDTATGVELTDDLPLEVLDFISSNFPADVTVDGDGLLTWDVGTLNVGETATLEITVRIKDLIPAGEEIVFTDAVATHDLIEPTPDDNQDDDTDTLDAAPDYLIVKTDSLTDDVEPGETFQYFLTVRNLGDQSGSGVTVTDFLPLDVIDTTSVSTDDAANVTYDQDTGELVWSVGGLAGNDTETRTLTVTVTVHDVVDAGIADFTNTATVTDDGASGTDTDLDNNSSTNPDTVLAQPDYVISTSDDLVGDADPGETFTYNVQVVNVGNQDGTGVTTTVFLDLDVIDPDSVVFDDPNITFNTETGEVTWTIGDLEGGSAETPELNITVTVRDRIIAGVDDFTLPASVTDDETNGPDPTPANNIADEEYHLVAAEPDYVINIDDGTRVVEAGELVTYEVTVRNDGTQGGTGVIVTDGYPTDVLQILSVSNGGTVNRQDGTITWNVGDLPAGEVRVFTVQARVVDSVPAGVTQLTHNTQVTDDLQNGDDPTPHNNADVDTDVVSAEPDYVLNIEKHGPNLVEPGDQVKYTLDVTNDGGQDGTGVVVTHYIPISIANMGTIKTSDPANVTINKSTGELTWRIGDLDGDGQVHEQLTIQFLVKESVDSTLNGFILPASVTDDLQNGADPTPFNNVDQVQKELFAFAFDSFNNFADAGEGFLGSQITLVTTLPPMPVDPIFSGIVEAGTTLVGRIYDEHGNLMGEQQVVADAGGNWMMNFPNTIIKHQPHRMEITQTRAGYNAEAESGFNLRRYFHPAIHTSLFFTEELTVQSVMAQQTSAVLNAMHEANRNPLGFSWESHSYQLNVASTNAGSM